MIRGISRCIAPVALFLLIGSFAFASAVPEQQTGDTPSHSVGNDGFPLEVTDALGTTVTIESRPQSIVSLSLFSDEVLFELLAAERFPGVTGLAVDPVYSNVAEAASAVEQRVEFNVEQLIDIFPDVVFAASWSEADKVSQLRDAGVVVYQADTPLSVDGIADEIRTLAGIVGKPDAGEAIVTDMRERIDALNRVVEAIPESERVESVDYSNWGTASGRDTTWSEVLRLAGVENAAARYEAGDFGQVPMSKELVVEIDPDVLFLPGFIWGDDDGADAFRSDVMADPAFADLQAVRNGRVYLIPENLKGTYSHFLVDAAEYVAQLVYPDYF